MHVFTKNDSDFTSTATPTGNGSGKQSKPKHKNIHYDMIAFNVQPADPEETEALLGSNRVDPNQFKFQDVQNGDKKVDENGIRMNPLKPVGDDEKMENHRKTLATENPLSAPDFEGGRFEGLVLCLRPDDTGLIVCYPFQQQPEEALTLLFHTRFVEESQRERLTSNINVEFSIGCNPMTFGAGLYGFVATDIVITPHGFTNRFIPVTLRKGVFCGKLRDF